MITTTLEVFDGPDGTHEMIALVQVSMMNLDPESELEMNFRDRLERIEGYLIRRYSRAWDVTGGTEPYVVRCGSDGGNASGAA